MVLNILSIFFFTLIDKLPDFFFLNWDRYLVFTKNANDRLKTTFISKRKREQTSIYNRPDQIHNRIQINANFVANGHFTKYLSLSRWILNVAHFQNSNHYLMTMKVTLKPIFKLDWDGKPIRRSIIWFDQMASAIDCH